MTQEAIIKCLQNGSLTSYDMENLTGIPRTSIVAACKKMIRKKQATAEKIKMGRCWIMRYTLAEHMIDATKAANDAPRCLLNPFDIRNAVGIFTKAEYAVMNSQARRLLGRQPSNEITNNQFI
jgi:acetyl-CoA acetyltransferase